MSRRIAALASVVCACMFAGCAPGANDELRKLVDDVAPAERSTVGCEWESNWGSAEVKSSYGCSWHVAGTIARVGRPIVSRLVANGFKVYCTGGEGSFEVRASRGKIGVVVEVIAENFRSQTISAEDLDIPRGHVLVSIGAAEAKSPAPAGPQRYRCVA
jgi:hypothetical protein